MAINIFQGSKGSSSGGNSKNQRSKSSVAAISKQGYETSTDGTVAVPVKKSGSKILDIVKGVSGVASKLPGWVGTVGGIVNRLATANDPEWWQSVPGNELPMSLPYNVLADSANMGKPASTRHGKFIDLQNQIDQTVTAAAATTFPIHEFGRIRNDAGNVGEVLSRPFALEIDSSYVHAFIKAYGVNQTHQQINCTEATRDTWFECPDFLNLFMNVTDAQIVQYVYPEIRKVNNAVVLQNIEDYKTVFQAWCLIYAILFQLRRMKYETTLANPLLPSLANNGHEIQGPMKSTVLSSLIQSIEEYIASYVRLPHTVIEYLAWRFGRVYKTRNAGIAPLVVYNVLPQYDMFVRADTEPSTTSTCSISYTYLASKIMKIPTATDGLARAAADMYNAYHSHNQAVSVSDDTQYIYDEKEFALRTNLRTLAVGAVSRDSKASALKSDANVPIYIPFAQDNATVFMASTVSTNHSDIGFVSTVYSTSGNDPLLGTDDICLFPVSMVKGVRRERSVTTDKLKCSKLLTLVPNYNKMVSNGWQATVQPAAGAIGGITPFKWDNSSTGIPTNISGASRIGSFRSGWVLCPSYHNGRLEYATSFIDLSTLTAALTNNITEWAVVMEVVSTCMALDYYNANIRMPAADVPNWEALAYVPNVKTSSANHMPYFKILNASQTGNEQIDPAFYDGGSGWVDTKFYYTDLTQPSIPCGFLSREVLKQEQVYAFANLTFATRHEGLTKGNAEHEAAGVLANAVSDAGIIAK